MRASHLVKLVALSRLFGLSQSYPGSGDNHSPTVKTQNGIFKGRIDQRYPDVRQFLKVPFAKPPVGQLRWSKPQPLSASSDHAYDATQLPASCPQWSSPPNIFNEVIPGFFLNGSISEDCLYLSVWSPVNAKNLPVVVFLYGGSFQTGGINIPYQIPSSVVQRTSKLIVVAVNYRLNIFGFPNAPGLEDQNLGILDQRAGLEWVRDNIGAFGGDASRIILWGQSAGAVATDYHNFAFHQDPIATGFFSQSGSAFVPIISSDTSQSNFSFVANHFKCQCPGDKASQLDCMRKIPFKDIQNYLASYANNGTLPAMPFTPIPDDKIVFRNYTSRYEQGLISNRPAIFSTCENEGNSLVPANRSGIDTALAEATTKTLLLCPTVRTSKLRQRAGRITHRYLFSGNFSTISSLPWMGAYHLSDVPTLFGTYTDFPPYGGPPSAVLIETSQKMQDLLLDFANNPEGLLNKGWPRYSEGSLLRFAAEGKVIQKISVDSVDHVCS
ncbi:hypothetical protein QQS21_004506 [Conoideocrella luteorostrata]|uniref:Carboxylic ester hydrolase n=1 Tax=Conoideocrella luteorostrata TaxID=1105319 RepID=A0AAJ0CR65_9HYPO|nr:hypothetical protein QQS21_004506 [Conoideocrella luteorostrata]